MRRRCSILVVFVVLAFGASLVVPAEDVPETAYDESEAVPYECTTVVSIAVPETVAEAPTVLPRASRFRLGTQYLYHMTGWAYPISDSLSILDGSLRC